MGGDRGEGRKGGVGEVEGESLFVNRAWVRRSVR